MPARLASRRAELPRYLAELPWLGPLLARERDGRLRIAAAADPALGKAFAALLVPVRRASDGKLEPVAEAWIAPAEADRRGRFAIDAPPAPPGRRMLLMVLLYERSEALLRSRGEELLIAHVQLAAFAPQALGLHPGPVSQLPQRAQEEIAARVKRLLAKAKDLARGLIEIDEPPPGPRDELTFAVASCQYPAGFLDGDLAGRSYGWLGRYLDGNPAPRGLLLLGDQVYVDATAGLFDPTARYDRYELPYERLLRMDQVRGVLRRLPVYAMLDDHEIEDNWQPCADEAANAEKLRYGRRAYLRYQRMAGPAPAGPVGDAPQPLWYELELDGFAFFMADTRSEREARSAQTLEHARIMSRAQCDALHAFLERHKASERPKFIVSPSAVLPRHRRAMDGANAALRSDTWQGYPASLESLLGHIAEERIGNVVFLSGDEHISFVTRALVGRTDAGRGVLVQSIHSSGLYAPYPFANSLTDDLARRDRFEFGRGAYRCIAHTHFAPPGDGFVLVSVRRRGTRWVVECRFHRAADPSAHLAPLELRLAR